MARKGIAILTIVGIIAAVVIGGGVVADVVLRRTLGVGILDIMDVLVQSGATLEEAASLEEVKDEIGIEAYNELKEQKDQMTDTLTLAGQNLDVINENEEVTSVLRAAFGEDYRVYMFSVTTIGDLDFKVFEWSIQLNDGLVTQFREDGEVFDTYNVRVQADQSVAFDLMTGNASPEAVIGWVTDKKLKINPILEVTRFINALPQVMEIVQSHMD
jgi:hypothetical protein